MLTYRTYPAVMGIAMAAIVLALSAVLTLVWPTICWLPRVGGLLAGVSVFILGYMHVNKERFDVPWRWGLTRDQAYTHFANVSAVVGALLGVFGDLVPKVLWVSACACVPKC